MDYNDNEFQSQNLHLAGEGNTKVPPVLRPYALPKFDFDDSLHGHLRFDSLVETEVFLGIENNEDNQWIEEYSRVGSGLEFRTSAAESCSISRHYNVWSEAASSESVEMLLKSVGQEENIPGKTNMSDARDDISCLVRQIEVGTQPDEVNHSKEGNLIDIQPISPPCEIQGNFSVFKEDSGGAQSLVDASFEKDHCESSVDGGTSDPVSDAVSGKGNITLTTEICVIDQSKGHNSVGLPHNKTEEDTSTSGIQLDSVICSTPKLSMSDSELNRQDTPHQKNNVTENVDGLQTEISAQQQECNFDQEAETNGQNLDGHIVDSSTPHSETPLCLPARIESSEEGKVIESATDNPEESSNTVKEDNDLHIVERCSENVLGAKRPNQVPQHDVKVGDTSVVNMLGTSPPTLGCDNSSERHEGEMYSAIDCKSPCFLPEVSQLSKSEASKKSDSHGEGVSSPNMKLFATPLPSDKQVSLTSEGVHDARGYGSNTTVQDSLVIVAESIEVCDGNVVPRQSDVNYMAIDVKASTELPSDSSNMYQEIVDASSKVELILSESRNAATSSKELALEDGTLISHDTTEASLLPPENAGATNVSIIHQKVQMMDACNEESQCGPRVIVHDGVIQKCVKQMDGCNREREVEGAEVQVISEKNEVTMTETPEKCSSKVSDAESPSKNSVMPVEPLLMEELHGEVKTVQEDNETKLRFGEKISGPVAVLGIDERHAVSMSPTSEPAAKFPALESGSGGACLDISTSGSPSFIGATELSQSENENEGVSNSSAPLSEPDANIAHPERDGTHLDKSACGSPTVIRATELYQSESERQRVRGSSNQNTPPPEGMNEDANKNQSIFLDSKGTDASKGDKTFTFEVGPLADSFQKEAVKNWQPFSAIQAASVSMTVEGTPTSAVCQSSCNNAQRASRGFLRTSESEREIVRSVSKSNSERKTRRTASKAAGKETARKGNPTKDATPRQSEKGDRASHVPLSPSGTGQLVQSSEMQYGHVDDSMICLTTASALPDLNTSSPLMFLQPFTDLQQVQLRAQIFVYGALIQGTAPDEPYMISAFGGPDGGRSMWETAWRACTQRLHGQKSIFNDAETPMQSRLGTRAPDQVTKLGAICSKVASPSLGQAITKGNPSPSANPIIPLSSPLWSIPTPSADNVQSSSFPRSAVLDYQQALTPLHAQQTPSVRNLVGHNTSWISQSPFCTNWVASPQTSGFEAGSHLPVSITDKVQLTSAKEPSMPPSGVKNVSSGPIIQNVSPATVFPGTSLMLDPKKISPSPSQHSTDPKPRKRKKILVSEDLGQTILHSQTQTEPVSAPILRSHMSTSVSLAAPASVMTKPFIGKVIAPVSQAAPADLIGRNMQPQQTSPLSEETLSKLKEAKAQAEDAAAFAAAAVGHCQEIWNQLDEHKTSRLESDVESKLTSAAVAIAAAAAVAKAAAAAANVASNAALQAKLMANEVLGSSCYRNSIHINGTSLSDNVKDIGQATPGSLLKGENSVVDSSSVIFAAREAARKHVEAASAASKRAENMDAIVRAAELAAIAVSQAGKIVALGDPLPLAELIEAGPDGCGKAPPVSSQRVAASNENSERSNIDGVGNAPDTSARHGKEVPSVEIRENETSDQGMFPTLRNMFNESFDDHGRSVDGSSGSVIESGKNAEGLKGSKASDLAKTIVVGPEYETGSISSNVEPLEGNTIKEGSCVEVSKEGVQHKAGWYTAYVSSLKDGKACVCYNDLPSDGGLEKLKEWVALEGERDEAPKIRIARPFNTMPFEGTRKRRRAALGEYTWSVGDRVDAWMDNSWWEGVVTEKCNKDETMFSIHFPAEGQTSAVRAWHLRPSLIWKYGEWVEWSNSTGNNRTCQEGDTPQEKRLRLGSPTVEAKAKDKILKGCAIVETRKSDEPTLLDLAANEKLFHMGKSSRDENKPDALRSGLRKEGSRVVFGVPKPGKKRKFMDVSKHYVMDQSSKATEANESVKFAKYLMPQSRGSGSRGWKNVMRSESKEKGPAGSRPKVLKTGKLPTVSGRKMPQKGNSASAASTSDDGADIDHTEKIKDFVRHSENPSGKHDGMEFRHLSSSEGKAEGPIVFSSRPHSSDAPRRGSVSDSRAGRVTKGKLAPAGGKLNTIEENKVFNGNSGKTSSEAVEPRRSNRRIQPTSRLLEGLQSSLIISKMPSVSHEKSHRSQSRSISKGNNHG